MNNLSPTAANLWSDYLDQIRKTMIAVPASERDELINELENHLAEEIDSTKKPVSESAVQSVIARLGSPEEIVQGYEFEAKSTAQAGVASHALIIISLTALGAGFIFPVLELVTIPIAVIASRIALSDPAVLASSYRIAAYPGVIVGYLAITLAILLWPLAIVLPLAATGGLLPQLLMERDFPLASGSTGYWMLVWAAFLLLTAFWWIILAWLLNRSNVRYDKLYFPFSIVNSAIPGKFLVRGALGLILITVVIAVSSCTTLVPSVSTRGIHASSYAEAIERGRNVVAPLTRRGSAVSVAVGMHGEVIWSQAFGYTSLDGSAVALPDHRFYLYSLMKQVTAVLALQAVLNGDIEFSTTTGEVFSDLPEDLREITLQQLITHRSGIRHYYHPAEANMFNNCNSANDALGFFINDPLVHTPGATETYSTYGFVLASAMLEQVTGRTFPQLINERIASVAGITGMQIDNRDKYTSPAFYTVDTSGEIELALPINNSCKMGGGGFLASAEDLVRFHNAVLNGILVPIPAIREMLGSRNSLEAAGSGPGGEAVSIVNLDTGLSIVILSNTSGLEQRIALERARDILAPIFTQ